MTGRRRSGLRLAGLRRSLQIIERGETVTAGGVPARRPASAGRARRCTAQRDTVTVRRTAERDAAAVRLHVPLRKRRRRWRRRALLKSQAAAERDAASHARME